MNAVNCLLIH